MKEALKNFTVRVSEDERQWLEKEAEAQHRPVANLIRHILSLYREKRREFSNEQQQY